MAFLFRNVFENTFYIWSFTVTSHVFSTNNVFFYIIYFVMNRSLGKNTSTRQFARREYIIQDTSKLES